MGNYLNPGNIGFEEIRNSQYVDKSGLIALINDTIGTNSIVVRSNVWLNYLMACKEDNAIEIDEVPIEDLTKSQIYCKTYKKGNGVKTNMIFRKIFCSENPKYDFTSDVPISAKSIISEFSKLLMRTIGHSRKLWFVVKLLDRNKD